MKNKYNLLKVLIAALILVTAGVIYSCAIAVPQEDAIETGEAEEENTHEVSKSSGELKEDADPESQSLICVHVCGSVEEPGVYYLEEGSRVHQAVEMAGGFTEGAAQSYVNLADIISDGEQIYIPSEDEAERGDVSAPENLSETEDGLVNINKASASELTTLAGIGESKAEAIIAYRENVAAFEKPEDLINVSGIGENIYNNIKDSIKVK